MLTRILLVFLFSLLVAFNYTYAQFASEGSSVDKKIQQYASARGENLLLYNGIEYAHAYPHTAGHPFFLTDTFQRSSLVYDDVFYADVPLAYDVVNNRVVIKNKDSFLIELIPEKVNSFVLRNYVFASVKTVENGISPGIYEIYNYYMVALYIKHQKVLRQAANAADLDYFTNYDEYYIRLSNNYFEVKSSSSLLTVFKDKDNEIKNYLRQNHLNFKKHPEETLLKVTAYYAQLKH